MKPVLPALFAAALLSAPALAPQAWGQEAMQSVAEISGLLFFDGRCQVLSSRTRIGLSALRSDTLGKVPGPGLPDALERAETRARQASGLDCADAATLTKLRDLTPAADSAYTAWSARKDASPMLASFHDMETPERPTGPRPPKPGDFYRFGLPGDHFLRDCDPGEPTALLPNDQIPANPPPNVGVETKAFPFGGQTPIGAVNARYFGGAWLVESADDAVKEALGAKTLLVKCAR